MTKEPASPANREFNATSVLRQILLGLVAGMAISGLALLFTGAGHGWNSGTLSATSIVGAPMAAIAWNRRGTRFARVVALITILIGLVTDVWLCSETLRCGVAYFGKVCEAFPLLMLMWTCLFLGWQLIALKVAICPTANRSSES